MNQVIAMGAAGLIALILWSVGKKPGSSLFKGMNKKYDLGQAVINQSLVEKRIKPRQSTDLEWALPKTPLERKMLKEKVFKLMTQSPKERLEAVKIAGSWGHSSVMPILRRGLKDSDSNVVITAATAISKHR